MGWTGWVWLTLGVGMAAATAEEWPEKRSASELLGKRSIPIPWPAWPHGQGWPSPQEAKRGGSMGLDYAALQRAYGLPFQYGGRMITRFAGPLGKRSAPVSFYKVRQ